MMRKNERKRVVVLYEIIRGRDLDKYLRWFG